MNLGNTFRKLITSVKRHALFAVGCAILGFALLYNLDWFAAAFNSNPPATQEEASSILRNFGLVLVGGYGIYLADRRLKAIDRQHALDTRSELFDRFQRSSAMLDSQNQALRQAGIVVLAEIAKEKPTEFYDRVINLLCSFLRQASDEQRELAAKKVEVSKVRNSAGTPNWPKPRSDMVEAMKQLGSLRSGIAMGSIQGANPDSKADLEGLFVPGFELSDFVFYRCNLSRAVFADTVQSRIVYQHCELHRTMFDRASLSDCAIQYCTANVISFAWCSIIQTIMMGGSFKIMSFKNGYADQKTIESAETTGTTGFKNPTYIDVGDYTAAFIAAKFSEGESAKGGAN